MSLLAATMMMTSGFTMMVWRPRGVGGFLAPIVIGFVLREVYIPTYEPDPVLDSAVKRLETVH